MWLQPQRMTETVLFLPQFAGLTFYAAYVGMALILAAFVLETRGQLDSRSLKYLLLMAIGSTILGVRAVHTGEWAFVVLELIWAGAAIVAIMTPVQQSEQEIPA